MTPQEAHNQIRNDLQRLVFLSEEATKLLHSCAELAASKRLCSMEVYLAVKEGIPAVAGSHMSMVRFLSAGMQERGLTD